MSKELGFPCRKLLRTSSELGSIKAVIFDLDDTLYPERQYALGGFRAVAEQLVDHLGDRAATLARLTALLDSPHRFRVFDAFLEERAMKDHSDVLLQMLKAYRAYKPTLEFHPDTDAAIERLRATHRLGLITDGRSEGQWSKIDALGLRTRIDEIIVTSDLGDGFHKPHVRAFELISEKLQVPHAACAYVADNPGKDFVAPNALGWRSIRVLRADGLYRDVQTVPAGEPHYVVKNLDDLEVLLA